MTFDYGIFGSAFLLVSTAWLVGTMLGLTFSAISGVGKK